MTAPKQYFIVDAFTSHAFAGNPAAVVTLDAWPVDGWLRNVAMEMNLSETAFLVPDANGYDLRWFTPKVEVDLCGHATLASAAALAQLGKLKDGSDVAFSTRSGILRASLRGKQFALDFPSTPAAPAEPPAGLIGALNVSPKNVALSKFDYLIELEDASAVRAVAPDFRRLAAIECRGVIVTARSDDLDFDFVSRFFAPAAGIDEDPVTGSAHCCLAPYWAERLGKTTMNGYQASPRLGIVHVELRGDRVTLGGEAVVVARGELMFPVE